MVVGEDSNWTILFQYRNIKANIVSLLNYLNSAPEEQRIWLNLQYVRVYLDSWFLELWNLHVHALSFCARFCLFFFSFCRILPGLSSSMEALKGWYHTRLGIYSSSSGWFFFSFGWTALPPAAIKVGSSSDYLLKWSFSGIFWLFTATGTEK